MKVPLQFYLTQYNVAVKHNQFGNGIKKIYLKISLLILITGLNWIGLSAILNTSAYFTDEENSKNNMLEAGTLDFELDSSEDINPVCGNNSVEKTVKITNNGNPFKYKVYADSLSGDLCDYLDLEANIGGVEAEYSGKPTEFTWGPEVFSDSGDWVFKLKMPADFPGKLQGQTCTFKLVFEGYQTKNDLPFGLGFGDMEKIESSYTLPVCCQSETRTIGYWKNHSSAYLPHLPQFLGDYPTDQMVADEQNINDIFDASDSSMRNKLKKQLLAMKFNIAHFGIGGYINSADNGKTLNELVAEADNLLRQNPEPSNSVLEDMKDLLDDINNLHEINFCSNNDTESEVVINEFLPNPPGSDDADKPDGEWIELYNKGAKVDVNGWVLYDANDKHELIISSGNTNAGSTVIGHEEFLVVYRDGDSDFALNNSSGDSIRLYDGEISDGATLIDSYVYTIDADENKSFARITDGSDNWVDPIPTPGKPNVLEDENEDKNTEIGPILPGEKIEENIFE